MGDADKEATMETIRMSRGGSVAVRERWLKEKGQMDQALLGFPANLWCVRGKVYDLESYMSKHPGGKDWLLLTRGQDVTDLVEVHHLNEAKVEAVLRRYYVGDAKRPLATSSGFTWAETGFYKTLKRRVADKIKGQPRGPSLFLRAFYVAVFLAWAACFIGACMIKSWWSWLLIIAAGLWLCPCTGIGHNATHQRPSVWRYFLDLSLFSHRETMVSHCVSHHMNPNSELDVEIAALEPFIMTLATQPPTHPAYWLLIPALIATAGLDEFILRLLALVTGRSRLHSWANIIVVVQLGVLIAAQGLLKGTFMWGFMHGINSWCLLMVAMPLHHSAYSYFDGMGPRAHDYGVYTVLTTADFATGWGTVPSLLFFMLLNNHLLHHLFPTIDESRLYQIRPLFVAACAEFNVPYKPHSWWDLLFTTIPVWCLGRKRVRDGPTGGEEKKESGDGGC